MPVLEAEAVAPNLSLTTTAGQNFSLDHARKSGPVILAFFKVGCPTCQYTFPYLERISKAYPKNQLSVVGISQDSKEDTLQFVKQFGVTFPVLLDDTKTYTASNAYRLTNVPSTFLVSTLGKIELTTVGWVKDEIEKLNRSAAKLAGATPVQIFKKSESVLDFKAA